MSKWRIYVPSILIPLLLGGAVGLLTSGGDAFDALNKPPLSPPAWLFPLVWSALYILMGVSYGMLKERRLTDDAVNIIYYTQLIVNLLWPFAFFLLKWRLFSFFWLMLLVILVTLMIYTFTKRYKTAGLLQLPYLLWVLFASYLNLSFYLLNR